jgi:hypothetical protein
MEDVIDYYKSEKNQQMELDAYFVYYEFRCYEKSDYKRLNEIGHELRNAFQRDYGICNCKTIGCKCKFNTLFENFLQTSKQYNLLTLQNVEQTVERFPLQFEIQIGKIRAILHGKSLALMSIRRHVN